MKKEVELVITDLDDTIWNWFDVWYVSFSNYFNRIVEELDVPADQLKIDFRKLHQKYGSSEFSFVYKELASIGFHKKKKIDSKSDNEVSILHQYYSDKKRTIRMYPTVHDTLAKIKAVGTKIVGFTESNSFFTKTRLKHLGLDGLFDFIYCPEDTGLPKTVKPYYEKGYYEPLHTKIVNLPKGVKKPNSEVLLRIISDLGIDSDKTIYIGDKLDRDISMANSLGVTSCYARYGDSKNDDRYALLREVSHWTPEEIEREKNLSLKAETGCTPSFELSLFGDLLKLFNFKKAECVYNDDDIKNLINLWQSTVDVQKHFNEIELRIRSSVVTLFTFLIAGIGYVIKEKITICFYGVSVDASLLLSGVAVIILSSLYFMDKHWYHRFLHSAVMQGMELENEIQKKYPNVRLTKEIKVQSPLNFIFKQFNIHSDGKITIFYLLFALPFIFIMLGSIIK